MGSSVVAPQSQIPTLNLGVHKCPLTAKNGFGKESIDNVEYSQVIQGTINKNYSYDRP